MNIVLRQQSNSYSSSHCRLMFLLPVFSRRRPLDLSALVDAEHAQCKRKRSPASCCPKSITKARTLQQRIFVYLYVGCAWLNMLCYILMWNKIHFSTHFKHLTLLWPLYLFLFKVSESMRWQWNVLTYHHILSEFKVFKKKLSTIYLKACIGRIVW